MWILHNVKFALTLLNFVCSLCTLHCVHLWWNFKLNKQTQLEEFLVSPSKTLVEVLMRCEDLEEVFDYLLIPHLGPDEPGACSAEINFPERRTINSCAEESISQQFFPYPLSTCCSSWFSTFTDLVKKPKFSNANAIYFLSNFCSIFSHFCPWYSFLKARQHFLYDAALPPFKFVTSINFVSNFLTFNDAIILNDNNDIRQRFSQQIAGAAKRERRADWSGKN